MILRYSHITLEDEHCVSSSMWEVRIFDSSCHELFATDRFFLWFYLLIVIQAYFYGPIIDCGHNRFCKCSEYEIKQKKKNIWKWKNISSYPRCVFGFVNIRWSLNMTRCTIPFGAAVVAMGLKFIRQFVVSMRCALSAATIIGHRFDGSTLNALPPKRLYTGWALINDNFCDFIAAAVAVPVVRWVDVDALILDLASAAAVDDDDDDVATMPPLFTVRLFCVDAMLCNAVVLFWCNNEPWWGILWRP